MLNIKYNHVLKRKKLNKSNIFLSLTTGDYPGIMQLNNARREVAALEKYVADLSSENYELENTYHSSYRLEIVRERALEMGMVPVEEKVPTHIYVTLPQIEVVEEPTFWEQATALLASLFA